MKRRKERKRENGEEKENRETLIWKVV